MLIDATIDFLVTKTNKFVLLGDTTATWKLQQTAVSVSVDLIVHSA